MEKYLIEMKRISESIDDTELASSSKSRVDREDRFSVFGSSHEKGMEIGLEARDRIILCKF